MVAFPNAFGILTRQFIFLYLVDHYMPQKATLQQHRLIAVSTLALATGLWFHLLAALPAALIAMPLQYSIYCLFFREGSLRQSVIWSTIAAAIFYLTDLITATLMSPLPGLPTVLPQSAEPQSVLAIFFSLFIAFVACYLLTRPATSRRRLTLRIRMLSAVMAISCVLFVALIISPSTELQAMQEAWQLNLSAIGFMILATIWLFTFDILHMRSAELLNRSAELFTLQMDHQRMERENEHIDTLQALYDRLRDLRHDFSNQMIALMGFAESNDIPGLKAHLKDLTASSAPPEQLTLTKFPQLDAVLSAKLQQAHMLQIKTEVLFVMPADPPLPIIDLCAIMGNILDNALEATQQVAPVRRSLKLHATTVSNMWQIRLINTCSGEYRRDDKRELLTTKKGNWHGVGLRRVRQLVEKYDGSLHIEAGVSTFTIDILLPWQAA